MKTSFSVCSDRIRSCVREGGDKSALSVSAQRGLKVFVNPKKRSCQVWHTIGTKFALLTDNKYHDIGVGADTRGEFADPGHTRRPRMSPTLAHPRADAAHLRPTAPYMHDSSMPDLKAVIDHCLGGGNSNPTWTRKSTRSIS